jgi:hypothetical protein
MLSPTSLPKYLVLLSFVVSGVFVHRRGKVRHGFARQITDHSTFMAPYNALMYLFTGHAEPAGREGRFSQQAVRLRVPGPPARQAHQGVEPHGVLRAEVGPGCGVGVLDRRVTVERESMRCALVIPA